MGGDLIQTPQRRWIQGAYESVQRGTLIVLNTVLSNLVAENRYSALSLKNASAGYQVTAGKTLYLTKAFITSNLAATGWVLGSGTTDPGINQIAAPTDPRSEDTYTIGAANPHILITANVVYEIDYYAAIAAGRYPFVQTGAQSGVQRFTFIGHEE